jgi:hypothetical protein
MSAVARVKDTEDMNAGLKGVGKQRETGRSTGDGEGGAVKVSVED